MSTPTAPAEEAHSPGGRQPDRPAPRSVRETPAPGPLPLYRHPDWAERFPWLIHGVTGRAVDEATFDLGLFGAAPVGRVLSRWRTLRGAVGAERAVHARQVHGAEVAVHDRAPAVTLSLLDARDGHATDRPGVLLTVSVADCVPISLVDPRRRAVALLHGGWRGIAAGILKSGTDTLGRAFGSATEELHLHLGPAICGRCYEVGPEVHAALGRPAPPAPEPLDLHRVLLDRTAALGIPPAQTTRSTYCTRCGEPGTADAERRFFSHRAGESQRQVAVLGVRTDRGGAEAPVEPAHGARVDR